MINILPKQSIKSWAEDDRPREKLLLKGKSVLSDAELIAILIRSGDQYHSAVDLAKWEHYTNASEEWVKEFRRFLV